MSRLIDLWKNMPFGWKISVLPALACLGFAVFLWVSWAAGRTSASLLTDVEKGHYASLELAYSLDADLSELQRIFQDAAATADTGLLADAQSTRAEMSSAISAVREESPLDTSMLGEFAPKLNNYVELAITTTRAYIDGDTSDQLFANLQRVNESFAVLQEEIDSIIDRDREAVRAGLEDIIGAQSDATRTSLMLVSVLAAVLVTLSWIIIKSATGAIRTTVESMASLARGDLSVRKQEVVTSRDEMGVMLGNVVTVTETINALMHEVRDLVHQVRAGRLRQRGNSAEFEGAYSELIENINELISAFVVPIEATAECVDQISQGHIPPKITDQYNGDFNKIKQSINLLVSTMSGLVEQTSKLTAAAKAGDLEVAGESAQFSGAWRDLIVGINQALDAVTSPVREISAFMSNMAKGDLDWRMRQQYAGMFEQLSKDANATGETLSNVIGSIRTSATTIQHGVEEVSRGNNNLSSRTESQAASLEETAANIEAMTDAVKSNAQRTSEASSAAESAREIAQQGEDVVNQAVDAMNALNASSQSIVEIIDVIDTIAFQTNLLALNAAVEAARAGEQGRGFAVVASEVRQLAGRSATAAREIKELINDSTNRIDESTKLVGMSGASLQEIIQSVKRVADLVAEISQAGQDQQRGIEEVNSVVGNLDSMTQQNAALVVEVAATSDSIGLQAADLMRMLEFFDVGESRQPTIDADPNDDEAIAINM